MSSLSNRRDSDRILADQLPESLKKFYITFVDGKQFIAETIDISRTGISFKIKIVI